MRKMSKHTSHRMRDTSLEAFRELVEQDLGKRQQEVLNAIRELNSENVYPTDQEITRHLGYYDPNKVRPRRNDLMDMGYIVEHNKRKCSVTGKTALTWKLSQQFLAQLQEMWWKRLSKT